MTTTTAAKDGREGRAESDRELALRLYRERFDRETDLPQMRGLWGDRAWDMLLDLFVAAEEGRAMDVKNACIGARVAGTTGLRIIERLVGAGFVRRAADRNDRRKSMIALTAAGTAAMRRHLGRVASPGEAPEPGSPDPRRSVRGLRSAGLR